MDQPTPEELLGHHYKYEIEMLEKTYLRIGKPESDVDNNALKESFCIHARALIEFYVKKRGAQKYAPKFDPYASDSKSSFDTWQQHLNNQVAHLLDGRTKENSKLIDDAERSDIYDALQRTSARFKQELGNVRKDLTVPALPLVVAARGSAAGPTNHIISTSSQK